MTRQERGSEATEGVFCLVGKKVFYTAMRTGFHYLIVSLHVVLCLSAAYIADYKSCATTISLFPHTRGLREGTSWGLTRGACFIARSLELATVAEWLWLGGHVVRFRCCLC